MAVKKSARRIAAREEKEKSFCVYLGPSIRGTIQHGTVIPHPKQEALAMLSTELGSFPLIAALIVTSDELPAARLLVRSAGTRLNYNYKKLASCQK